MTAPIALFVYNRPRHTRETIEALRRNPLAAESDLFIFSDGPRRAADRPQVEAVRRLIGTVTGFRSVAVSAGAENRGLAQSIISGVTELVERHGRVIVLEDDLITSPYFLTYMNEALDRYADVPQVMHVSGYQYPIDLSELPDAFFLRFPSSWGWSTWARAWQSFRKDPAALKREFSPEEIRRFCLDDCCDFWETVIHNLQGKANTWAVFWYAAIFRQGGLCLYPRASAVCNIGHDGTGVHCVETTDYETPLVTDPVTDFPDELVEHPLALARLQDFFVKHRIGRIERFLRVVRGRLKRLLLPARRVP